MHNKFTKKFIEVDSKKRLEALEGIDRRDFMAFCATMAATLGLTVSFIPKIAEAIEEAARKPSVIWMHFAECTGDSEAFIRSTYPSTEELIFNILSIDYHETIMAASGTAAEEALNQAMEENRGKYIAVCEGAIPTGTPPGPNAKEGDYLTIAGKTGLEIAAEVCGDAAFVMCVGNCACFGGVQAQYPNPTNAKSVGDALRISTINIAGCPHNPVNSVATILYYLLFGSLPKTDGLGRPLFAFGKRIHDTCPRRAHFDAGLFVEEFGDQGAKDKWCLHKMGCKGPLTYHNCATAEYNDGTSWPIKGGHGCVGCSEPNFWDQMSPFYSRLPYITPPHITPPDEETGITGGGGGGGNDCFIATAAYGSYLHPHVGVLREFRDKYLLTNAPGRKFVSLYYSYSPPIADFIAERSLVRAVTRWSLTPIIFGIKHTASGFVLALSFIPRVFSAVIRGRYRKRV